MNSRIKAVIILLIIYIGVTLAVSALLIHYYYRKEEAAGGKPEVIVSASRILKADSIKFFTVFGLVMNKLKRNISSVAVNVTFFSGNRKIATGLGYAEIKILRPGEKSPFFVYLKLDSSTPVPSRYNFTVSYKETDEEPIRQIRVAESSYTVSEEGYCVVTGTLENVGIREARSTKIICVYYDSKGNLLFMAHSFVSSKIEPYGRRTFSVSSKPVKISSARYELYVVTSYEKLVTARYELLILIIVAIVAFVIIMKRRGW